MRTETKFLSDRIQKIKPSPTLEITALAARLKEEGKDVVGFGAGEPDFDTPQYIKEACKKALDDGFTKYTPTSGLLSFRKAIQEKFKKDNQLEFKVNQIITATGGKQIIYNLLMSTINQGDEVLFSSPYWVSYYDMVILAEGTPKIISTDQKNNFKIMPDQLEQAITPRSKLFILNSPSNPTGSVYTKEEMISLVRVLEKHPQLMIFSDDIYEKLIYDDMKFYNLAMLSDEILSRSIVMNGLSKSFSMTGWRLGYAASKMTHVIKAMIKLQGQSTSNPTSFSQKGGEAALLGNMNFIDKIKGAFVERRDFLIQEFQECFGVYIVKPQGAFYIFPMIDKLVNTPGFKKLQVENPEENSPSKLFAKILLEKYQVAVIPGIAFGCENSFRISYATSMEEIKKGMNRIKEFIDSLTKLN